MLRAKLLGFFVCFFIISFIHVNMSGCSGGSGTSSTTDSGGSTDSVDLPDQLSLVSSDSSTSASISKFVKFATASPEGDYASDEGNVEMHVDDNTGDKMSMINDILCMIGQTKAEDMLDQGAYLAMIEVSKCDKEMSDEQENTSSGQSVEFETWTVDARDNGDGTGTIYVWIPPSDDSEEGMEPFNEIRIKIDVTDGMTDANPYGIWQMNFVGYWDGMPTLEGYLASLENADGDIELAMRIDGGDYFNESTHAIMSADGLSGQARIEYFFNNYGAYGEDEGEWDDGGASGSLSKVARKAGTDSSSAGSDSSSLDDGSYSYEEIINIAFDENLFAADYGDVNICLDRTHQTRNVWRYNIYDATTGARADINSGMSIRLAGASEDEFNHESFGWAGYWGVWPPEMFTDGTAVVGDDDANYTVFVGGVRVTKNTREDLTLESVIDVMFSLWDEETNSSMQVKWDGTNFVKIGSESCDENGCEFIEVAQTTMTVEANQWIGLWSHGMGRLDLIVPGNGQLNNATPIALYRQQFMSPTDFSGTEVSFMCYYSCPKSVLTQAQADASDIYFDDVNEHNGTPYTYILDLTTFKMTVGGLELKVADGVSLENTSQQWGIGSGAMVTSLTGVTQPWMIWSSAEFYNFEFGTQDWNRYTGLKAADGSFVGFDTPMQCLVAGSDVTSPEGDSDVTGVYMLEYQGDGDLFGIPYEEVVDEDTGFSNWQNEFVIPDGTIISCSNGTDESEFVTRQMSIMLNMTKVESSECASLTATDLSEPEDLFVDPAMDEAPSVTSDPAVVSGVVL